MRCCAQVRCELGIRFDGRPRCWRASVAVAADQPVDLVVFAEPAHARSEHDELTVISNRHACAIDGLVTEPGAVELVSIEPARDPIPARGHSGRVHRLGQLRCGEKCCATR